MKRVFVYNLCNAFRNGVMRGLLFVFLQNLYIQLLNNKIILSFTQRNVSGCVKANKPKELGTLIANNCIMYG